MTTITSANAVLTLQIDQVYPLPTQIQGFSADDAFEGDEQDVAETYIGVDGSLSGGLIFNPSKMTITLMADSPSGQVFDDWYNAELGALEKFIASGTILMPSVGLKFTMTKGFLGSRSLFAKAARVLQPRKWGIIFESVLPSPQ